jgi:HlyD family secretion protein
MGHIRTAKDQRKVVNFTVDAYPDELFPGRIEQARMNSTTTQNVVTYPVIIEAKNPDMKLMPGMTANISFQIEVKDKVVRVPAAALRFVPLPAQVRPEDKHYLEAVTGGSTAESGVRLSATEKTELAKKRSKRQVWVQDGPLLRAVPLTLGLTDNQSAELIEGDLKEGDEVVTGTEGPAPAGAR